MHHSFASLISWYTAHAASIFGLLAVSAITLESVRRCSSGRLGGAERASASSVLVGGYPAQLSELRAITSWRARLAHAVAAPS
jgi:hypothetical protein